MKIGFLYKRTEPRLTDGQVGSLGSYMLYGAETLGKRGWTVVAMVGCEARWVWRRLAGLCRRLTVRYFGIGGDFAGVFSRWKTIRSCGVVVAVGRNPGIPILVLKSLGLLRCPVILISMGTPGLDARPSQVRRLGRLLARAESIFCFGSGEPREMLDSFCPEVLSVRFVPFGFPIDSFPPARESSLPKTIDVLSVGADRNRDFQVLVEYARAHPLRSVSVIGATESLESIEDFPPNLTVEARLPLIEVMEKIESSRVAAIPVRENSYSGGTTFLIHALASGLPVVVSETAAIRGGYGLEKVKACRRVAPGDSGGFHRSLDEILNLGDEQRDVLGKEARAFALENLSDRHLVDCLESVIVNLQESKRA